MWTLRFSPVGGEAQTLHHYLKPLLIRLPMLPGVTGAHLLRTETPDTAQTAEQTIRGGDAAADWVLLVSGYAIEALKEVVRASLGLPPESRPALFHQPPLRSTAFHTL